MSRSPVGTPDGYTGNTVTPIHPARFAHGWTGIVTWLLLIWVSVALIPGTAAQPDRVVAIGDIHSAVGQFRLLLETAGLTDSSQRWTTVKCVG